MLSSLRSTVRRRTVRPRTVLLASGTAVLLAVGGGATAAVAASTPAPSASTAAACAPHLGALLRGADPKALRADLKQLRAEPKDQRAAERKAIRQKMLSGAYGARVERLAHLAGAKGHGVAASLPAALKTDLKALRALTPKSAERKAAAEKIADKALAGGYGTAVQTRAKAVQARVAQRCAAKG